MQGVLFLCGALGLGLCVIDFFDSEKRIVWYARFLGAWTIGIVCLGFITLVCAVATRNLSVAIVAGIWVGILASAYKIFQWLRSVIYNRHQSAQISINQRHKKGKEKSCALLHTIAIHKFPWLEFAFLVLVIVIFFISALQAMLFDQNGFPYGILKGWGDGAYHLGVVQNLAHADPFVLQQPIAAGTALTYPFFVNFLSALLLRDGLPFAYAWHIPVVLFGIGMIAALYAWGQKMLGKKALAAALVWVAVCGGGLGFIFFGQVIARDAAHVGLVQALVQNIQHPQYEYTHLDIRTGGKPQEKTIDQNIVWIVPLISFFSHQRSFVLGTALGLLMLLGLWEYRGSRFELRWLILLGLLPLIHTHTFIALGIFAFVWIMYAGSSTFVPLYGTSKGFRSRRCTEREYLKHRLAGASFNDAAYRKRVLLAVLLAFVIALPQIIFLYHGLFTQHQFYEYETGAGFTNTSGQEFFTPWFGWMACTHNTSWLICDPNTVGTDSNVVWFWVKNFGFVFMGWIIALGFCIARLIKKMPIDFGIRVLCMASFVLFALANLIKFQPWEFDNNKILFWWWVFAIILALSIFDSVATKILNSVPTGHLPKGDKPETLNPVRNQKFLNGVNKSQNLKIQTKKLLLVVSCSLFVILSSFSGVLDVWGRVQSGLRLDKNTRNFGYYGVDEIAVANWISNNTNPNDVFVTHSQATQFIPMLSGRAIYLGFPGWLWTQGHAKVILDRQQAIRNFVLIGNSEQLCADGVSYVLDDSQFEKDYGSLSGAGMELAYEHQTSNGESRIYKLQCR